MTTKPTTGEIPGNIDLLMIPPTGLGEELPTHVTGTSGSPNATLIPAFTYRGPPAKPEALTLTRAVAMYGTTGKHFGTFATADAARAYAKTLPELRRVKQAGVRVGMWRCPVCGEVTLASVPPSECPHCGSNEQQLSSATRSESDPNDLGGAEISVRERAWLRESAADERRDARKYAAMARAFAARGCRHLASFYGRLAAVETEHIEIFEKLLATSRPLGEEEAQEAEEEEEDASEMVLFQVRPAIADEQAAAHRYAEYRDRAGTPRLRAVWASLAKVEFSHSLAIRDYGQPSISDLKWQSGLIPAMTTDAGAE